MITKEETGQYLSENKERFLDELFELLRIPSVSADPKFKEDVQSSAICKREI
jgi:acetylornithine deacetylase/succinyl-diaminopimelate desuccinylase-like protein